MSQFWAARSPGERRMLILCALVAIVCVPLMLSSSSGGTNRLLSAADARQQYRETEKKLRLLDADSDRLKPLVAKSVYTEPTETLIPKIVGVLQDDAKKAGIHIREIKPLRAKEQDNVTKQSLRVTFACDFAKTVPFFYLLDDPTGKIIVEKFDISAPDTKSREVQVQAQIALFTLGADTGDTSPAS